MKISDSIMYLTKRQRKNDCQLITTALEAWPERLTGGTMEDFEGFYCAVGAIRKANGFKPSGAAYAKDISRETREIIIDANDGHTRSGEYRPDRRRARRMKDFCQNLLKDLCSD